MRSVRDANRESPALELPRPADVTPDSAGGAPAGGSAGGALDTPPEPARPRRAHLGIEENVRFLIIEVEKQLQRTALYLAQPSEAELSKIIGRDDYIDNLKAIIQSKSFAAAAEGSSIAPGSTQADQFPAWGGVIAGAAVGLVAMIGSWNPSLMKKD